MIVTVFLLLVAQVCTWAPLFAQNKLFSWSIGGPGTTIMVVNNTNDHAPLSVTIGDKALKGLLPINGRWGKFFAAGYGGDVTVFIGVCGTERPMHYFVQPPTWATDTSLLGDLTLTPDYLASLEKNPSERDLERRVNEIKNSFKGQFGRKDMIAELDDWFRRVKQSGLNFNGLSCDDPAQINAKVRISEWDYNYNPIAEIVVQGDREGGYRIQAPRIVSTY